MHWNKAQLLAPSSPLFESLVIGGTPLTPIHTYGEVLNNQGMHQPQHINILQAYASFRETERKRERKVHWA